MFYAGLVLPNGEYTLESHVCAPDPRSGPGKNLATFGQLVASPLSALAAASFIKYPDEGLEQHSLPVQKRCLDGHPTTAGKEEQNKRGSGDDGVRVAYRRMCQRGDFDGECSTTESRFSEASLAFFFGYRVQDRQDGLTWRCRTIHLLDASTH